MVFDNAVDGFAPTERIPLYAHGAPAVFYFPFHRFTAQIFFHTAIRLRKIDGIFKFFLFQSQRKRMVWLKPTVFHLAKPYTYAQYL